MTSIQCAGGAARKAGEAAGGPAGGPAAAGSPLRREPPREATSQDKLLRRTTNWRRGGCRRTGGRRRSDRARPAGQGTAERAAGPSQ